MLLSIRMSGGNLRVSRLVCRLGSNAWPWLCLVHRGARAVGASNPIGLCLVCCCAYARSHLFFACCDGLFLVHAQRHLVLSSTIRSTFHRPSPSATASTVPFSHPPRLVRLGGGVSIERVDHRKDPLRCEVHNERDRVRIVGRDRRIWIAMARRYDSRTTIFSPEGRLYQVEYAMEAIGHAGACVGVLAKDGIVLAAEKKITSKVRAREPRRTTKERRTRGAHETRRTKICIDRMGPRWVRSSWTVRSRRRSNVATLPRRTKTKGQSERRTRR